MKYISLAFFISILASCSNSNFKGSVHPTQAPATADVGKETLPTEPSPPVKPAPKVIPALPAIDQLTAECAKAVGGLKVLEQSVSYAERKGCNFGKAPNIQAHNEFITASETSTQMVNLPQGKICEISIESAKNALLHYDDMLVLSIESNAIFVSTDALLPFMEQKDNVYQWDFSRVVGKKPRDFGGKSYCIGDAAGCVIPDTDKTGPVAISLPNSKIAPISVAIQGKSAVSMNLTALGDNDDSDCSHTQLDLKVTFKYIP